MTKKQKTLIISILVILLLIVFLSGFTFARYYAEYTRRGSLGYAKWIFDVDGWNNAAGEEIVFLDTETGNPLGGLFPGFSGKTTLELSSVGSQMMVKYNLLANETTLSPTNMYFYATENNGSRISKDGKDEFPSLTALAGAIGDVMPANTTKTIEIYAIWPSETTGDTPEDTKQNNIQDALDIKNVNSYDFSLTVTGEPA